MIDVKKLAEQAGMNVSLWDYGAGSIAFTMGTEGVARGAVERFAALVLEAAALECDEIRHPWGYSSETPDWIQGTDHCATAIRAMKPGKEQT